jgi:hypothetical protein
MFPAELPTFEATWWPVHMETVPGSGEAITVAVVVRAASGQAQVRQSIDPSTLQSMFGGAGGSGKGVLWMVIKTVLTAQEQLDAGVPVEALELPFGGFSLGPMRDGVARDMNEVFDIAVRLSAAFGLSPFGRQREPSDTAKRAFADWADRVRVDLLANDHSLVQPTEFDVRIRLATKYVQIGFLRGGYASNFGVLRPGKTSGDTRSLKVKVFDLEALRRDQIVPVERTELLIGCPSDDGLGAFSRREAETFRASLDFMQSEASARKVKLVRFAQPAEAARHLREQLAA